MALAAHAHVPGSRQSPAAPCPVQFDEEEPLESLPSCLLALTNLASLSITAVHSVPPELALLTKLTSLQLELSNPGVHLNHQSAPVCA